jgi:thioredoxin 1
MAGLVAHITDADFEGEVLKSEKPVLVDFWAPWCGPCLMIGPMLEAVAEARGDAIKVVKINVDESSRVAKQMGIRSIPTLMLFRGGELQQLMVGARPRPELDAMIDKVLCADATKNAGTAA